MKKIVLALLVGLAFVLPHYAGAVTVEEQIQALLQQINALQAQIQTLMNTQAVPTARTSDYSPGWSRNLSQGMSGADVTALQQTLASMGFYSGDITGYFGPQTFAAVQRFQSANGLEVTGFVGVQTRGMLNTRNTLEAPQTSPSAPTVTVTALGKSSTGYQEPQIDAGAASNITFNWSSQNAASCNTYGQTKLKLTDGTYWDTNNLPTSGTRSFATTNQKDGYGNDTSYTTIGVQCWNSDLSQSTSRGIRIVWTPIRTTPEPPSVTLTASPSSITAGQSSTLTAVGRNVNYCSLSSNNQIVGWQSNAPFVGGSNYYVTVSPTSDTTYAVNCYNSTQGGANGIPVTASATITVSQPTNIPGDVSVTLSANPSTITSGQSTTLTWSSKNATYCDFGRAPNGSWTVTPDKTTTYQVTCYNPNILGSYGKVAYAIVTVNQPGTTGPVVSGPTVTLTANPTSVQPGGGSLLELSSTNASSCSSIYIPNIGMYAWKGGTFGQVYVYPESDVSYSVTCTNSSGQMSSASVTITVMKTTGGSVSAPSVTVTASPESITPGQTSTVYWSSQNAASCTTWDSRTSGGTSGYLTVTPSQTTTYSVSCSNSSGQTATASVTVYVSGVKGGQPIANVYSALSEILKSLSNIIGN